MKKQIEDKAGIPVDGQPLDDDKPLSDYDIPTNTTVDLVVGKPMKINNKSRKRCVGPIKLPVKSRDSIGDIKK